MVVSAFCASAGTAPRIANATISVFITGVPLSFVGVKACREGIALPPLLRSHPFFAVMAVEGDNCNAQSQVGSVWKVVSGADRDCWRRRCQAVPRND